jgi:hypothetical protein
VSAPEPVPWELVLGVARRAGYTGPAIPGTEADLQALADALREATGVDPWPGTGPGTYVAGVLAGEVPL